MDIYQGLLEGLKYSVRSSQVPLVSNPGPEAQERLAGLSATPLSGGRVAVHMSSPSPRPCWRPRGVTCAERGG